MTITTDRTLPAPRRSIEDLGRARDGWAGSAACRGVDAAMFTEARHRRTAKKICGTCPVRWDCLLSVLQHPDDKAVRGAMTSRERRIWLAEEGISGKAPEFDPKAVERMVTAGVRWEEIGAVYDVSADAMQSRWRRYLDRQENPPPRTRGPRPAVVLDLEQVGRLRAAGKTFDEIGKVLGCSPRTVGKKWRKAMAA